MLQAIDDAVNLFGNSADDRDRGLVIAFTIRAEKSGGVDQSATFVVRFLFAFRVNNETMCYPEGSAASTATYALGFVSMSHFPNCETIGLPFSPRQSEKTL